jgi:hypothetical protein
MDLIRGDGRQLDVVVANAGLGEVPLLALIAAQTVLREDYWRELAQGFTRTSLDIFHVLLHVNSGRSGRAGRG